jgi:hypothetical protein
VIPERGVGDRGEPHLMGVRTLMLSR